MKVDVAIVGGGPAGSTLASFLLKVGWSVAIVEREQFPRHHIGESLVPQVLDILSESGALPVIEKAGFLRKEGGVFVWGRQKTPWSFYFDEAAYRYEHTYAYQVVRAEFDSLLLDHARRCGAKVLERCEAKRFTETGSDVSADAEKRLIYRSASGSVSEIDCRFVADCSGIRGWLAQKRRWRNYDRLLKNVALYSYWSDCGRLDGRDQNSILCEAVEGGWLWFIPLHTGETSIGFVTKPETATKGKVDIQRRYEKAIDSSRYVRPLLARAVRTGPLRSVADYSYTSRQLVGPGFLLAGDAGIFIDPVWSTGVFLSLASAQLAAPAISDVLRTGGINSLVQYERDINYLYTGYRDFIHFFYSAHTEPEGYFWKASELLQHRVDKRDAFIRLVSGRLGYNLGGN